MGIEDTARVTQDEQEREREIEKERELKFVHTDL